MCRSQTVGSRTGLDVVVATSNEPAGRRRYGSAVTPRSECGVWGVVCRRVKARADAGGTNGDAKDKVLDSGNGTE